MPRQARIDAPGAIHHIIAGGIGFDQVWNAVSQWLSLQPQDLIGPIKERAKVKSRMIVCYWAAIELGISMTEIARKLGIAVPTVSVAVKKGRNITDEEGLLLANLLNVKM